MEYRHELKFQVSDTELERIRQRIDPIMDRDAHMAGDCYTVRSLYFDDMRDTCLSEVLSGVDDREKFRLRLYDGNPGLIHLEKKAKRRGMTRKLSQRVGAEVCAAYMAGEPVDEGGAVAQALLLAALRRGMAPRCIVEYDRTAYVEEVGNVRVTFDRDIRGTGNIEEFLSPELTDCEYVLAPGQHVLEVKYDEFLPEYILQALDLNSLRRTSFSKYAYVRQAI